MIPNWFSRTATGASAADQDASPGGESVRGDSGRGGGSAPGGDSGAGRNAVAGPPCVVPGGVPNSLAPGRLLGRLFFLSTHPANSPGSDPSGWPGGRGRGSTSSIGSGS